MPDHENERTQRDIRFGIAAELTAAGFENAEEIGRGGFGVVYRCLEPSLDRTVAVKVLTSEISGDERERFVREQHALGRLSGHPNIVAVHQADVTADGRPFIVMPFHSRGSLDARLRATGPLPWQELLSIGVKIAGALAAAHATGTLHRDVKPANILVTDYGEPQLADFGIAHIGGGFETSAGRITGTPAFIAPEVLRGAPPSVVSDVYGLGATMFCLLTGHAAVERQTGEAVLAHFVRVTSTPGPDLGEVDVPAELRAAIEAAMATDPDRRPRTAVEFGYLLRDVQRNCGLDVDAMAVPADAQEPRSGPIMVPAQRGTGPRTTVPPPVASTKYRPPTSARPLVDRPRLLRKLQEGGNRRLLLIHAPPGFGKSTLAAQWRDVLTAQGMSVAWLTIDHDDNNVVWFLAHLVEAIRRSRQDLAGGLVTMLEERSNDATRYVLASLIDEVHDSGAPLAVVIDDWHLVTDAGTRAAMEFLLDNGCHHLRVIVTGRTRAGLPLSRMRVGDELVEIDSDDLRFDDAESTAFLLDINRLTLGRSQVAELLDSTEGWIAALQLASLSLRGSSDPAEFIDQLSGRHEAIGEYLVENVLDTLDRDLLDFLLATSITEKICAGLAEALSGPAAPRLLRQVKARDLFLRNVDFREDVGDDFEWFRYHRMFGDFLRRRLAEQDPDTCIRLHRIAADWFADHAMLNEAVDHALAARDSAGALRLIEERATELLEGARTATLLGLVAKLPTAIAVSSARLQLFVAWGNISLQRPVAAEVALDRVDAVLGADRPDADDTADLRLEAMLARAACRLTADRFAELPEFVAHRLESEVNPFIATIAAGVGSAAALYRFDFDEVYRWQRWVAPHRARVKGPAGLLHSYGMTGVAAFEQLDIAAAQTHLETARSLALETGRYSYITRMTGALLGALCYWRGELDEAEALLDESVQAGPEGGAVEFVSATYGIGARIAALRGDLGAARERLAEGAKMARNLALPRLAARIVNERIRLGLPIAADEAAALERLEPYRAEGDGITILTSEIQWDSAIRLLLADHSAGAAETATVLAERLVRGLERQGRPRALLEARLLSACCLVTADRLEEAIAVLDPVLAQCAELGLPRLAADAGAAIEPAVVALIGTDPALRRTPLSFLTQLLPAGTGRR
ncbi:protein kinase [Nocardia vinacea]|uniref:protein kinase domain-containing protein n=1 Tax=Nocardia vinacea TaxID=96468 RepID=UPI0033F8E541